ncbi:LuxR C-terminal-related transcriptional regulator [Amphibiibacter pelophylacis]|uniref:LuxR C-terminal-related transcriptional regulator n=1 Tax=Amphibiibacter pelophylacis TaxID=1799477 RepID=A0ACC6P0C2_9BURK
MPTLLLVCEDLDQTPEWNDLLTRFNRDSPSSPQVLACGWHQARRTLHDLRQRSAGPAWVVLQTRRAQPWQWHVLDEVLQPLQDSDGSAPASVLPMTARSYSGGRARLPGQAAKPPPELQRVMENVPALHWVSAGQTGRSPLAASVSSKAVGLRSQPTPGQWHPGLLSQRRREVFELMVDLFYYKEIARRLGISAETVKDHARGILEACDCRDRVELVSRWAEWLRQQNRAQPGS